MVTIPGIRFLLSVTCSLPAKGGYRHNSISNHAHGRPTTLRRRQFQLVSYHLQPAAASSPYR